MSGRRRRSRRSYLIELILAGVGLALLVAALYLGWFAAFGQWFAEQLGR